MVVTNTMTIVFYIFFLAHYFFLHVVPVYRFTCLVFFLYHPLVPLGVLKRWRMEMVADVSVGGLEDIKVM